MKLPTTSRNHPLMDSTERPSSGLRSRHPSCPSDEELAGFVDGTLAASERVAVEGHLDSCARCRATLGHVTATDKPARTVGRYRLDAVLGHGGMGVVWRAWDPALEREVAVKLLHPELHDERWRRRALREARALARLQHPNVIAVHDVGEAGDELFIATELIDGEPLDRWQRGRGALDILGAYAQAARGLHAAHSLGLVHRDVKPNNILVSRSGRVCVGDFGLAISAPPLAAPPDDDPPSPPAPAEPEPEPAPAATHRPLPVLTGDGVLLGTPAYMAPEQRGTSQVDARADQYALCLALAEALLGRRPLDDTGAAELAEAYRGGASIPGASGAGAVLPWREIARGLALRPEARFPDLTPLIAALEEASLPRIPLLAADAPPPPSAADAPGVRIPDIAPRPGRRRRLAILAFATLSLGGGATWRVTSQHESPATARAPAPAAAPTQPSPPATWIASAAGPWRLPSHGRDVTILDDRRAAVTLWSRADAHRLMLVDLVTGATSPPRDVVPEGDSISFLRRLGDRVLAFGEAGVDDRLAVWQLAGYPLTATPLHVPSGRARRTPHRTGRVPRTQDVVVAPDGATFLWCAPDGATLRDARSLAVIRFLPDLPCDDPRFTATDRLVLGEKELDLRTGAARTLRKPRGAPAHFAGPLGHRLTVSDDLLPVASVRNADRVTQREFFFWPPLRWTPDGVAISLTEDLSLSLRPDREGRPRKAKLSSVVTRMSGLDVDVNQAILVDDAQLEHVDLRSGSVRGPDGNRRAVVDLLPYRGGVAVLADELRLWSPTGPTVTEPLRGSLLQPVPALSRVAVLDESGALWLWDPATNQRRKLTEGSRLTFAPLAARGDSVWLGVEGAILRSTAGGPAQSWLTFPTELRPTAIDPAGRVVWFDDRDRLHLAELSPRRARTYQLRDECHLLPTLALAAGQLAIATFDGVVFLDPQGEPRRPDLPAERYEIAIGPDGTLWLASDTTLTAWRPGAPSATVWPTGVPAGVSVTAVAIDPEGRELAIGYDTGALVYVTAEHARALGQRRDVTTAPDDSCLGPGEPASFDELVTKVH